MGDTIAGRFTLLDPIAGGGSGTVWIARDERFGRLCAAKVLRQRDSGDLLRFVRENTMRLDHPHILAPYAWAAEDAHVAIAMPLVTGGTLEETMRERGRFSPAATAAAMRQILAGLTAVHEAGWIHRDIKPANIMIDAEQPRLHLLVADFGIAVEAGAPRLTHSGVVYGTPGFVSPEVMMGGDISPAQDVWAAGQIGRRMLGLAEDAAAEAVAGRVDPLTSGLVRLLDDLCAADARRRPSAATAAEALAGLHLPAPLRFADGTPWVPVRRIASQSLPQSPAPTLILTPEAAPHDPRGTAAPAPGAGSHAAGSRAGSAAGNGAGNAAAGGSEGHRTDASGAAAGAAGLPQTAVAPMRVRHHPVAPTKRNGTPARTRASAGALATTAAVFGFLGVLLVLVGIFVPGAIG